MLLPLVPVMPMTGADAGARSAREQFDVAEHLDAAGARLGRDRLLERHTRRHHHLRGAVEQRQIEPAETQVEVRGEAAELRESGRIAA